MTWPNLMWQEGQVRPSPWRSLDVPRKVCLRKGRGMHVSQDGQLRAAACPQGSPAHHCWPPAHECPGLGRQDTSAPPTSGSLPGSLRWDEAAWAQAMTSRTRTAQRASGCFQALGASFTLPTYI